MARAQQAPGSSARIVYTATAVRSAESALCVQMNALVELERMARATHNTALEGCRVAPDTRHPASLESKRNRTVRQGFQSSYLGSSRRSVKLPRRSAARQGNCRTYVRIGPHRGRVLRRALRPADWPESEYEGPCDVAECTFRSDEHPGPLESCNCAFGMDGVLELQRRT